MKIVYISVGVGGSDTALLSMLDALAASSSSVQPYVVIHKRSGLKEALEARGIAYLVLKYTFQVWPKLDSLKNIIKAPWRILQQSLTNSRATSKLVRFVKENQIDCVHSNVGVIHIGYAAALRCKIPHVWHLREYQDLDLTLVPFPSKTNFLKKLQHPLNYNIAITDDIFRHFQLNPQNSRRIYDGVVPNEIPPIQSQKENYFLFAGIIAPHKGVSELIDAFIEFTKADKSYQLKVAGRIPSNNYTRSLYRKIHEQGLADRIQFLGYCNPVSPLMASAAALIVPSYAEAFGLITAEAMLNGCLVIGKDSYGTKEQFDNGLSLWGSEIGLRFTTTQELVDQMNQVKQNGTDYYTHVLIHAQNTVKSFYSIEENARQTKSVYQQHAFQN